ncbi:hypothetical protein E4P82_03755 [Candidatus Competibacter phosphatis]|uniref:Uncharacterized protein n=1 Tax=Candidatus Competibacter phosphatis TaxID=221280 RepID=A0ABX1TKG0_9GAMM|nr:hypothetical protein [Candidatus Competibacter phosphatis]NMQ18390.1 hypothetical protein [Candidatus Competibacter phosphatis]
MKLEKHLSTLKLEKNGSQKQCFIKIVQVLFPSLEVVHHYRGKELEGLEIDVWIPKLKIGIEYQGIQHFNVIKHWGGEDGLRKTQGK